MDIKKASALWLAKSLTLYKHSDICPVTYGREPCECGVGNYNDKVSALVMELDAMRARIAAYEQSLAGFARRQSPQPEGRAGQFASTMLGGSMNGKAIDLMDGGVTRVRVTFWKGENIGDWLIGKIVGFTERIFAGQTEATAIAIFQPCAISDGSEWHNAREAQVVLSTELAARISTRGDRGRIFAIRFDGFQPSTKGNDARLYTVVEQSAQRMDEILAVASA